MVEFSRGLHGTSESQARHIAEHGFEMRPRILCFALPDDIENAQRYGRLRANEKGDETFGIVVAEFVPTKPELGSFGSDGDLQLEIEPHLIRGVAVTGLQIYDLDGNLREQNSELFVPTRY